MSGLSKVALVSALSNSLWFLFLYLRQMGIMLAEQQGAAMLRSWGLFFVLLIGGMVVLDVIATVFFTLREKKKYGKGFDEVTDERDRQIEARADRRCLMLFFASFMAAMGALALGGSLLLCFQILAFGVLLSALTIWLSFFLGYEHGV